MPILILYALFGFLVGVLLNRAADNLPPPARRSFWATPRCRHCAAPRTALEQSGLLGYLFQRGRCHNCAAPLPLRAPLVELGTALLFAFLWIKFGLGLRVLAYSFFTAILLLVTVIDLEHRRILDVVVLPATLLAILLHPFVILNEPLHLIWIDALLGAGLGYLIVWGIYLFGVLFTGIMARRGRALDEVAYGFGDVKLAGLIGALLGFPAILYALVYGILLGGVVSLVVLIFQWLVRRRSAALMAIPYGPFFTIVAWLFLIRDVVG